MIFAVIVSYGVLKGLLVHPRSLHDYNSLFGKVGLLDETRMSGLEAGEVDDEIVGRFVGNFCRYVCAFHDFPSIVGDPVEIIKGIRYFSNRTKVMVFFF